MTLIGLDVTGAWLCDVAEAEYRGFMVGLTVLGLRVEVWFGARERR